MPGYTRLMTLKRVIEETGLSKSTIYDKIKDGSFPAPVQIGPKMVRWRGVDLEAWEAALQTFGTRPKDYHRRGGQAVRASAA